MTPSAHTHTVNHRNALRSAIGTGLRCDRSEDLTRGCGHSIKVAGRAAARYSAGSTRQECISSTEARSGRCCNMHERGAATFSIKDPVCRGTRWSWFTCKDPRSQGRARGVSPDRFKHTCFIERGSMDRYPSKDEGRFAERPIVTSTTGQGTYRVPLLSPPQINSPAAARDLPRLWPEAVTSVWWAQRDPARDDEANKTVPGGESGQRVFQSRGGSRQLRVANGHACRVVSGPPLQSPTDCGQPESASSHLRSISVQSVNQSSVVVGW